MPRLVLGPLLRYVGETEATVWVETDAPCEVEVLGHTRRTFHIAGHHYAIVYVRDLEPGATTPYEVALDGDRVWPEPDSPFPPPAIRTPRAGDHIRMIWGSCRVAVPHHEPYTLKKDDDDSGREIDAANTYALRMTQQPPEEWPHVLLWLGDQIYADEVSPGTRDFILTRRDPQTPPGEEVADFEEYAHLYWDSWRDPAIRWLLSTVSSAMIFDDHDVHDDWNTSRDWVAEMRAKPWWDERIAGAFMSYWCYQHLGNLSPRELEEDELYSRVCEADDGAPILHSFALSADRDTAGARWSYCRDIGRTRLLVIDSRAGRVLDGERKMLDDAEWDYIVDHCTGSFRHLLLATSLPFLLPPAVHWLEAWDEAIAEGAWGKRFAKWGERLRQEFDLEHWAAFEHSFKAVVELVKEVGSGRRGDPPESIVFLSGDVHNAYLAEVAFPKSTGMRCPVYQAVCSPFRNPLDAHERRAIKFSASTAFGAVTHALARGAGVSDPGIRWRLLDEPVFDNQISTLDWSSEGLTLRLEKALPGKDGGPPRLDHTLERRLV